MTDQTSKDYAPGLDALRALSVTLVVISHMGFGDLIPGALGVTIFFFISGYLIIRLLMAEQADLGQVDLPRFYGRRMLRLLPELLVLLAVTAWAAGPLLDRPMLLGQAEAALFYWTNYYILWGMDSCTHCAVTGHLWSLSVEEHFYLLAPLAMVAAAFAPRRLAVLFAGVIVASMTWRAFAYYGLHHSDIYTYKATECRLDSIAWGCLAAVIERHWPAVAAQAQRWGVQLFLAGGALLLASLLFRDEGFRATWRYSLQGFALMLLVPAVVSGEGLGALRRIMEWAPLRWMGRRSYGAYLWHYLAMQLAGAVLGVTIDMEFAPLRDRLIALPMVLIGVWILAAASYAWVFKPAQKLKPYLLPRRAAARPDAAGAMAQGLS